MLHIDVGRYASLLSVPLLPYDLEWNRVYLDKKVNDTASDTSRYCNPSNITGLIGSPEARAYDHHANKCFKGEDGSSFNSFHQS